MSENTETPAPEAGQIWRHPIAGEAIVGRVIEGHRVIWSDGEWSYPSLECWQCIGIETEHGRIMVGEIRAAYGDRWTVATVEAGAGVKMRCGRDTIACYAADVARWPLHSDGITRTRIEDATRDRLQTLLSPSISSIESKSLSEALEGIVAKGSGVLPLGTIMRVISAGAPAMPGETAFEDLMAETNRLKRERRETYRREIGRVLAEDARRCPAFATARRAAVLAYVECQPDCGAEWARSILATCRHYEERRGGLRLPSDSAARYAREYLSGTLAHYERARGLP